VIGIPVAFGEASHHARDRSRWPVVTSPRPLRAPGPGAVEPSGRAPGELPGLTGLRIVAAAWVVVFHAHFTPLPAVAAAVAAFGPLVTGGALGVDLFFVLSGFVIAHTSLDRLGPALRPGPTARFLWARVCRLWPAYVVVLHLFGLWLAARLYLGVDEEIAFQAAQPVLSGGEYLAQLLLVQLWTDPFFDGTSWVGPTWSISAEWLAYLLFPVAALGFHRIRRWPAPVLALAAVAALAPLAWTYLSTGSPYYPWSWLVRILCGFGSGVLAYLTVRRLGALGPVVSSSRRRVAAVAATVLPVLIVTGLLAGEWLGPGRGGAVIVLFPVLVGALAVADRGPARLLSTRAAVSGGRLSYGLYLVHIPLLEVYWLALRRFDALAHPTVALLVGAAVLAASVPVAALLYRLVEEPARRALRLPAPDRAGALPRPVAAVVPAPRGGPAAGPARAVAL